MNEWSVWKQQLNSENIANAWVNWMLQVAKTNLKNISLLTKATMLCDVYKDFNFRW